MDLYLTDTIVIKEGKLYHDNKLVKRHNWHLKLEELGWSKLHKSWISKLNKIHNPYPTNSLFGSLECGDDGDCLFHCIATALNSSDTSCTTQDYPYDATTIRKLLADSISQEQYDHIITCYRSMKDVDDFDESWDPYEVDTLAKFKEQVQVSGHGYWGDHLMIELVTQVCHINLFILTQDELEGVYDTYPLALRYHKDNATLVLLYQNNNHFKLVGHFDDIMNTYFTHESLPLEIKRLFNVK